MSTRLRFDEEWVIEDPGVGEGGPGHLWRPEVEPRDRARGASRRRSRTRRDRGAFAGGRTLVCRREPRHRGDRGDDGAVVSAGHTAEVTRDGRGIRSEGGG